MNRHNGTVARAEAKVGAMGVASVQLLTASALSAVLGYMFWFLLARGSNAAVVGEASAAVAGAGLVSVVVISGLVPTLMVVLAGRSEGRGAVLWSAVCGGAGTSAAVSGTVAVAAHATGTLGVVGSSWTAGAAWVLGSVGLTVGAVLDAAHTASQRSSKVLVRSFATSGLRVGALLAAIVVGAGISTEAVLGVWAAALWAGVVPAWRSCPERVGARGSLEAGRELLARFGWNHLGAIAGQAPMMLLPVMVTALLGAEVNAWFYMGWQLAAGCHMVSAAVAPVLLAEVARGEGDRGGATRRAARIAGVLGVAACAATLAGGPAVLWALGETYAPALGVLLVMVAAAGPDAVTGLAVARWRAEGLERRAAVLNTAMAAATVGGAWVGLGALGGVGAALAFLVSQSLGAAVVWWFAARTAHRPIPV